MISYAAFTKINDENIAYAVGSSLERMNPSPDGVGVLKLEGRCENWEVSAFFSKKPNSLEIKILEVVFETDFVVSKIQSRDWVGQVQRKLSPVRVGRFFLHGRHDREAVEPHKNNLQIEASMAFGTGHHATTVGCLSAFDFLLKRGYSFRNIADIGCGTGVLAMAAACTHKSSVIAADIDMVAIETANINLKINGLKPKISLVRSRGFRNAELYRRAKYDLIFANILADPLSRLANSMAKYTQQNGLIILSGLLINQLNRVEGFYLKNNFCRVFVKRIDHWVTIVMQKK